MVSHLEVLLPEKPPTRNNIGKILKDPQRQFWKEALFVQYDKKQHVSLISATMPIKSLPKVTIVLHSLIAPSIKDGDCSDACTFFARHCENGSSHIKDIDFDQYYSPVSHSDSFIINFSIADMNRITARILDFSNEFQNKNVPIHEIVCVSPQPYYLDWFERSYPNVPIN